MIQIGRGAGTIRSFAQVQRGPIRYPYVLGLALVFAALLNNGCVWWQIEELVEDSNAAIISTILTRGTPGADPSGEAANAPDTNAAIEDIEQFIAQNPNRPRIIASLRVRQGILLLNAQRRNAARAAFAAVASADDLVSQRDLTLYRISEPLVWWYGAAQRPAWTRSDISDATRMLNALAAEGDGIPVRDDGRNPSIRFFVEQMRVRIALKAAKATADENFVRQRIQEDVVRYTNVFDRTDQDQIRKSCRNEQVEDLRFDMVRWYVYTASVFDDARVLWQELEEGSSPLPSWTRGISRADCPGF